MPRANRDHPPQYVWHITHRRHRNQSAKATECGAAGGMRVPDRSAVTSAYDADAGSIADVGADHSHLSGSLN